MSASTRQPLATVEQLAAYCQVSVDTVYDWRRKGVGPRASRVGRHLRYRWTDVERWLDQQAEEVGR